MNVTMQIDGLRKLAEKSEKLQLNFGTELEFKGNQIVEHLKDSVPTYPPPPPNSTYQRTGRLGRGFRTDVKPLQHGVKMILSNVVVYSPYVISSERTKSGAGPQARIHRGRWYTLQGHVLKNVDYIKKEFQALIRRMLKNP